MKALLSIAFALLTAVTFASTLSFSSIDDNGGSEVIKMRVAASLEDCTGYNGNTHCYSVQKGASIGMENWETLREQIEGLNYEAGYVYDITVRIEQIENPAANGPRVKYILVDVISKVAEN